MVKKKIANKNTSVGYNIDVCVFYMVFTCTVIYL